MNLIQCYSSIPMLLVVLAAGWACPTLYGLGRKNLKKTTNFWARKGPKSEEQIYKNLNLMK